MLAALFNFPRTEPEWSRYSFNHWDDHQTIVQAIMAQKGVSLNMYPIDPMPFFDLNGWLMRHQQFHIDMNGTLALPGTDLLGVDIKDEESVQAWIWANAQEHQQARAALKI